MAVCPITLEETVFSATFSPGGLRLLHPRLKHLEPLDLTHTEQLRQARLQADKMSIQGVQPKLSAVVSVTEGRFQIVDTGGRFILKPNPPPYAEVPQNEALTMTMAKTAGIDVPPHGLIPAIDGSWVYVVKRFDRSGRAEKIHVEDFAQLSGATRETKYEGSMERVAKLVEEFCSFPVIEKAKLARRALFCFLTGNEDMHLKNWSLMMENSRVTLAPAYDLLNTTLVLEKAIEEIALPLNGKKKKLTQSDWLNYYCKERLQIPEKIMQGILAELSAAVPQWRQLISRSFLSPTSKDLYAQLLDNRLKRLGLNSDYSVE